jgi:flagellar hook-length control protein FliK
MDANLNSISSILPDVNLRGEKSVSDLKADKGPSFNTALEHAQKTQPKAESKAISSKAKVEKPRASGPQSKDVVVEDSQDSAAPQPMKVVKGQIQETMSAPDKVESKGIDDKAGVIAQSYDGIAVSYPLSKIAKDSLDEKTVTKLKDAGLWDLPTLVMAQPSKQLLAMKEMGSAIKVQDTFPMAKPISQFMASLENELGIEPDRLVQAFKKLPPGQLSQAPEKTMAQVMKNLDLNPKDEAKATALFSKMLSQMKSMETQSETVDPALLAAIAGAKGTNVPHKQVGEKAVSKAQVATSRYVQSAGAEKTVGSQTPTAKVAETSTFLMEEPQSFKSMTEEPSVKGVKLGENQSPMTKSVVSDRSQTAPATVPVPAQMNQVENQAVQVNHSQAPNVFTANQMSIHQNPMEDKSVKEIVKGAKESKETLTVKGSASTQGSVNQLATQDTAIAKPDVAGTAVTGGGIANAELKAGNDSKHEAIRSIVNQAQMLAQKGGGEIRMTLKPDHLGEIQLKVAMEGNRVNVSMTAERGEVKKLIEQSIHELRHGLATHNLSMDKLDVSVSNRDTSGFKGQPDFGAAKDFANQFHQQQSNRREMMEDLSSIRGNALKSMTGMDRASQVQKTLGARSMGRLNVVA